MKKHGAWMKERKNEEHTCDIITIIFSFVLQVIVLYDYPE